MELNYLVIEGNIGAGKTSLAKILAEDMNARLVLEKFEENPFLPKFYIDADRYAFPVELTFLADRYMQLKEEINPGNLFHSKIVSDYYFYKSLIFSRKTLKEDEFQLYKRLFEIIQKQLSIPDLYVYLHQDIARLLHNIQKRGRGYEREISKEYLLEIQNSYFDFMKSHRNITFLILDVSNIDFVANNNELLKIKDVIFNSDFEPGMNRVIL